MERRAFVKQACLGCAGVIGLSALASAITGCSPLPSIMATPNNNLITLDVANFIGENKVLVVKNKSMEYDILLVRNNETEYTSLYMQCSHENQPLTATKTALHCSSHGSSFNLDGSVLMQPATKSLKKFKTETINNQIIIHLNKFV